MSMSNALYVDTERTASMTMSADRDIIDLSRRKWSWMSDRDVDSLADLFHEGAVFVHMGGTMTRDEELEVIRSGVIHYAEPSTTRMWTSTRHPCE